MVDPTGEFAFVPWLLKASAEAAVDALMQATINYFFDPNITTVGQAISSIDLRQVGVAFVTGLLPGGRWVQSLAGAAGDVIIYILDAQARCGEPDLEEMLRIFGRSFVIEVGGSYLGDLVAKYGTIAVAKGLKKLGFDELAEKLLRQVDDVVDDAGDVIDDAFPGGGSSRRLAQNLIDSGVTRPPNTAAHHIVAGSDQRAALARSILAREGIDIDGAINGVFLPESAHRRLHTRRYYDRVNELVTRAAPGQVRNVLAQIVRDLLAGTFP